MFIFTCPFCHQKFNAEQEWSGRSADCPACGKRIIITSKPKPYAIWILVILLISCCGGVIQVAWDEVRLYQYKQYLKSIDFNNPPAMDFKYVCLDMIKSYATGCTILGIPMTGPYLTRSEAAQRISDKYLYRIGNLSSVYRDIIGARENVASIKRLNVLEQEYFQKQRQEQQKVLKKIKTYWW